MPAVRPVRVDRTSGSIDHDTLGPSLSRHQENERTPHIVATGAGKAMMERRDDPTLEYLLRLTGKSRPRVLFVGTATGDDPAYIASFYRTYDSDRASPHHLPLFHRSVDDLATFVRGFDVIAPSTIERC